MFSPLRLRAATARVSTPRSSLGKSVTGHSRRRAYATVQSASTSSPKWLWIALPAASLSVGYIVAKFDNLFLGESTSKKEASTAFQSTMPLKDMPDAIFDLTEKNVQGVIKELQSILGEKRVNTDAGPRKSHSSTEWSAAPNEEKDIPSVIVFPETTEEVSAIAKACHARRIPMIAFSGGTSLEGTLAMTTQGGVSIDFGNMKKVIAVHEKDMDVVVEPGVEYEELNQQLGKQGLFFPPDPGPGAKIGGMISQSCSGTNAYRYGTIRDWVLGLTIVLVDGTIVKTRHRPRKSNAGYNLAQLIIGSEGTLGFITEASLKLTKKPENIRVAVVSFPNIHKAVETAVKVVQADLPLEAMELLDAFPMKAVNAAGYTETPYSETPTLFLKFSGSESLVKQQIEQVKSMAQSCDSKSWQLSTSPDEVDALWMGRKTALWSLVAMKDDPDDEFLSADTAVPISRLADAAQEVFTELENLGLKGSILGHVGDGNFHTSVLYGAKDKDKARKAIANAQRRAIEMKGTITGEHGIGLENRDMLVNELGGTGIDTMRQIKLALDPLCLLNPDKVFRMNFKVQR